MVHHSFPTSPPLTHHLNLLPTRYELSNFEDACHCLLESTNTTWLSSHTVSPVRPVPKFGVSRVEADRLPRDRAWLSGNLEREARGFRYVLCCFVIWSSVVFPGLFQPLCLPLGVDPELPASLSVLELQQILIVRFCLMHVLPQFDS